jgi:hypothetical protein
MKVSKYEYIFTLKLMKMIFVSINLSTYSFKIWYEITLLINLLENKNLGLFGRFK